MGKKFLHLIDDQRVFNQDQKVNYIQENKSFVMIFNWKYVDVIV
jgi:hypothetical protein